MAVRQRQPRGHATRVLLRAPVPGGRHQPRGTQPSAPCRRDNTPGGRHRRRTATRTTTPASPASTCGCTQQVLQVGLGDEAHRAEATEPRLSDEGQRRSQSTPSHSPGEAATQGHSLSPPLNVPVHVITGGGTRGQTPRRPGTPALHVLHALGHQGEVPATTSHPACRTRTSLSGRTGPCPWGRAPSTAGVRRCQKQSRTHGTEDTGNRDKTGRVRPGPANACHAEPTILGGQKHKGSAFLDPALRARGGPSGPGPAFQSWDKQHHLRLSTASRRVTSHRACGTKHSCRQPPGDNWCPGGPLPRPWGALAPAVQGHRGSGSLIQGACIPPSLMVARDSH